MIEINLKAKRPEGTSFNYWYGPNETITTEIDQAKIEDILIKLAKNHNEWIKMKATLNAA